MLPRQQQEAQRATWICAPCAFAAGAAYRPGHTSIPHDGACDICKRPGTVVPPYDFAWQLDLFDE